MICPYCEVEVSDSAIEAEDGYCPECGNYIMKSSFRDDYDDFEEEEEEVDELDELDELEDIEDLKKIDPELEEEGFHDIDFDDEPLEGYEEELEEVQEEN